jgi:hypothetical protein
MEKDFLQWMENSSDIAAISLEDITEMLKERTW